jgi:hypothetical protein
MSIDAAAILRIARLPAPDGPFGIPHPVLHAGDATLVNLMQRWGSQAPDEMALALRAIVGDGLDAHTDARGVLFFSEEARFSGETYDDIVAELAPHGVWAPKVGMDHVPESYTAADPSSHNGIVSRLIDCVGKDEAMRLSATAEVAIVNRLARPHETGGEANVAAALAPIEALIGAEAADMFRRHVEAAALAPSRAPIFFDDQ